MKMPTDRPKGKTKPYVDKRRPTGKATESDNQRIPPNANRSSKVGVMGKDDDGARKRYHRGLLSGKQR